MKKVVIIQQIIPEYRKSFFNLLKNELAKSEIELFLIYGNKSNSYKSGNGVEIEWGDKIYNKYLKLNNIEICWQPVLTQLKDKDLIIVEQANKLILNYLLILSRYFWNRKIGFWGHGMNLQADPEGWKNKFKRFFFNKCDWWWAYTMGVRNFLVLNNFPSNRITVVQNSIDTKYLKRQFDEIKENDITKVKSELGIEGDHIALFCGGLYREKRIDFLLECCYIIKEKIPDFQMIFIGRGPETEKVLTASKNNNWIHYEGSKMGKERIKYFKMATFQLMPGAVGLSVIDSFTLETPIITTSAKNHGPEIEYIQNEVNGIITDNTKEAYSQKVVEMFKPYYRSKLRIGCSTASEKYTLEIMVDNFKKGIISCLKNQ